MSRRDELRAEREWIDRISERNRRARNIAKLQRQDADRRKQDDLGTARAVFWAAFFGLVLYAFALYACMPAHAAEPNFGVVLHGLSIHGKNTRADGKPYSERNPGVGLRMETSYVFALQAGRYRNSLSDPDHPRHSNYLIADYTPWQAAGMRIGGFAGGADGYPLDGAGTENRILAVAGLSARATLPLPKALGTMAIAMRSSPSKHSRGVAAIELQWVQR